MNCHSGLGQAVAIDNPFGNLYAQFMIKRIKKYIFSIVTKRGTYSVVLKWDSRDKAYLVSIPSLPEVITFGKTLADAKRMAKDAIELHCDCLIDEGNIIIDDTKRVIGKVPRSRVIALDKVYKA